jgi:sulfate permease, SulP family
LVTVTRYALNAARCRLGMRLPRRLDPHDVIAGVSVAIVLVPQSLAYAQLAGVPAYRGLYAASIPPLVAAPFASSPYLQPGPTAITALLTYGALTPLAGVGSPRYVALGLLLALLVGLIRVTIGVLSAGGMAYLMSQPLLVGFVPAAAILICASQVPAALGARTRGSHEIYRALWAIWHVHQWRPDALIMGGLVAGALAAGARLVHPRCPTILFAVTGAIVYSKYAGYGGPRLGAVYAGVPPITTSVPLDALPRLIVPAAVIAILGFAEASSIARTYAALERKRWDPNKEFVSQGVANLAAGAFGGIPVGASFSRSALNRLAGARTNASGFVTGVTVLAFLPIAFVLAPLPTAVLAAVVIVAVVPLIRVDRIVEIGRLSRVQVTVSIVAFVLTLILAPHVEWAIVAAIGLSIAIHLWRELRLDVAETTRGERLQLGPQGVLWFGNARRLEDRFVELLAAYPDARSLVIQLDGLGRIDLTGAVALKTLISDARSAGLEVTVRGAPPHAQKVLRRVLGSDLMSTPLIDTAGPMAF